MKPAKTVYLSGCEEPGDEDVRFRLTYRGPLFTTQGEPRNGQKAPPRLASHKHDMRKQFHKQLKVLWQYNRFLSNMRKVAPPDHPKHSKTMAGPLYDIPLLEWLAHEHRSHGFRFVPMVYESAFLLCSLDVLFLRRDPPGSVISAGDIDNRLKTLIDALRIPLSLSELGG